MRSNVFCFLFNGRNLFAYTLMLWLFLVLDVWPEVFEQSMFFYHTPNRCLSDCRDNLSVNINLCTSSVCAHESFDASGNTVPLFGRYGALDFDLFAKNVVSLSREGDSIYRAYPETLNFQNNINTNFVSSENKKVYCSGRLQSFEMALSFQATLPEQPFYIRVDVPFRLINVRDIEFVNITNQHNEFTSFLNKNITSVLREHNFEPLSGGYEARGVSDAVIRLGWHGQERFTGALVRFAWGDVSMGLSLPSSIMTQSPKNFMFHIPLGYGGALGAVLKYEAGIEFNQRLEVLVFGENWLFLRKRNALRLLHNEDMGCFNFFKEAEVQANRGAYWSVGALFKARLLFEGLYMVVGYSYHSQEASYLDNTAVSSGKDSVFFDKAKRDYFLSQNTTLPASIQKYDRENRYFYPVNNALLNKDPRLQRAYAHIIHLSCLVQPDRAVDWCDGARISLSYHHPIFGKSTFAGFGVSGQVSLGFNIDF